MIDTLDQGDGLIRHKQMESTIGRRGTEQLVVRSGVGSLPLELLHRDMQEIAGRRQRVYASRHRRG